MFTLPRQFCINLWNVAGALHSPNGMCSHSKNPKFPTVKAVYCYKASSIAICQKWPSNPGRRSIFHQLNSQWLLVSLRADRSLSWFSHLVCKSQCRTPELHLSCSLTQWHYTKGSGLGNSTCFQHFLHL